MASLAAFLLLQLPLGLQHPSTGVPAALFLPLFLQCRPASLPGSHLLPNSLKPPILASKEPSSSLPVCSCPYWPPLSPLPPPGGKHPVLASLEPSSSPLHLLAGSPYQPPCIFACLSPSHLFCSLPPAIYALTAFTMTVQYSI